MSVFEDATMEKVLQAVNKLHEAGQEPPSKLYMSRAQAIRIVKLFNDESIVTKGEDGNDYIWGMMVLPDNRIDDETFYLM